MASDSGAAQDLCAMLVLGELELLTFVNQPCCDYNRITGSEAWYEDGWRERELTVNSKPLLED